jgi:hypothetical protein
MNFDVHIPYPLRKEWMKEALRFDFATEPGMCLFSTILNCSNELGAPLNSQPVRGWLGRAYMAARVVDAKLAKNQFASLNSRSLHNPYIVSRLEQLFPDRAPWELDAWPSIAPTNLAKHDAKLLDERQWRRVDAELRRRKDEYDEAERNGMTDSIYPRPEIRTAPLLQSTLA